ncbi:MAG: hypothetical protein HN742_30010 [Lentisphaerae bacterium]|jgi:type II secretory pathway pseudopilin PulG|nr:hypothetical protein [Lentisphaerota bacterium]MBT7062221.1 hypothetical protein [Lentisphaerota bacterium]MBT7846145.1 hypothetical protein [Lentisphaerota bacterium]
MAEQERNKRSQVSRRRWLTLVEMTIILSVIAILTAVLVPTVMSHITQSRILRARQDVRTLSDAITRFYQDTGFVPKTTDSVNGVKGTNGVDLLVSAGRAPALPDNSSEMRVWAQGKADFFGNHLVNNVPGYTLKSREDVLGWNGPYLATTPEADPWGNRYMVNVVHLNPSPGVVDNGEIKRAVFVVSAGPDGVIETPFDQPVTDVSIEGDDIVHRMQ